MLLADIARLPFSTDNPVKSLTVTPDPVIAQYIVVGITVSLVITLTVAVAPSSTKSPPTLPNKLVLIVYLGRLGVTPRLVGELDGLFPNALVA